MLIRQQIVDILRSQLSLIKVVNGYSIDIKNVYVWRATPLIEAELPAVIIRDVEENIKESLRFAGAVERELKVQIQCMLRGESSDRDYRKALGDLEKAIRLLQDARGLWFNGLVYDVRPGLIRLIMEQEGFKIAFGIYEILVYYITKKFNSYDIGG